MAYISSNANRWYCAREAAYGQVPAVTGDNRIPAVKLAAQQQREKSQRKDKTGSRTFTGLPAGMRLQTTFSMTSYMRDWADPSVLPSHGPLIEAAMGGSGSLWAGNAAAQGSTTSTIKFVSAHGLQPGQAITSDGEIRFVAAVPDSLTVVLNAPLSIAPDIDAPLGQTATYMLERELPSVSLLDYWDPASAVQRVFSGAAVDKMSILLNGDFHQFEFKGNAKDVIDSSSFTAGQGMMETFPEEPVQAGFSYSPVPGNLGQVWLGVSPTQFLTVAEASIQIDNDLDMRSKEFGTILPLAVVPGLRSVAVTLELLSQDDEATTALYQAARQQSPVSVMFQLGQVPGQLIGVYLKSLVPGVPVFDDADRRLRWKFTDTRAQGTVEDEIVVAFG
jgi:hypothetical protein